jgi:copper chaperone
MDDAAVEERDGLMVLRAIVLAVVLASAVVPGSVSAASKESKPAAKAQTTKLIVGGMDCEGCAKGLTTKLKSTPGVKSASIDFKAKSALVSYDPAKCKPETLIEAAKKAGYTAEIAKK